MKITTQYSRYISHVHSPATSNVTNELTGIDVSWLLETFSVTNSGQDSVGRSCELTHAIIVVQNQPIRVESSLMELWLTSIRCRFSRRYKESGTAVLFVNITMYFMKYITSC